MLRSLLKFTFGNEQLDRDWSDGAAHDQAFRITAANSLDSIEIEDACGVRHRIALSYGAQQTIAAAMQERKLDSAVGLLIQRERFVLEGAAFTRWSVLPPTHVTLSPKAYESSLTA